MNLIIEVGNTNIKILVFNRDEIVVKKIYPSKEPISTTEFGLYAIKKAILSGSGDTDIQLWENLNCKKYKFHRDYIRGIQIDYKNPETLGSDRLLNTYMASIKFPKQNNLIIDCGTCITFTYIDESNFLKGGSISPGLNMQFHALHHFTHKLPKVLLKEEQFDKLTGDDTESSILSGVYLGTIYEIDRRIEAYREKYENLNIIMTGGDAHFFANKLKNEIFVDSDWTHRALNHLLNNI